MRRSEPLDWKLKINLSWAEFDNWMKRFGMIRWMLVDCADYGPTGNCQWRCWRCQILAVWIHPGWNGRAWSCIEATELGSHENTTAGRGRPVRPVQPGSSTHRRGAVGFHRKNLFRGYTETLFDPIRAQIPRAVHGHLLRFDNHHHRRYYESDVTALKLLWPKER